MLAKDVGSEFQTDVHLRRIHGWNGLLMFQGDWQGPSNWDARFNRRRFRVPSALGLNGFVSRTAMGCVRMARHHGRNGPKRSKEAMVHQDLHSRSWCIPHHPRRQRSYSSYLGTSYGGSILDVLSGKPSLSGGCVDRHGCAVVDRRTVIGVHLVIRPWSNNPHRIRVAFCAVCLVP